MIRYGVRAFALLALLLPLLTSCGSGGATTGKLKVTITGLPSGAKAAVTVNGLGSYSKKLTATQTLSVAPGSYTLTAQAITSGQTTYRATVSGSPATISAGATSKITVTYARNVATTDKSAAAGGPSQGIATDATITGRTSLHGVLWNDHDDNGVFDGGDAALPHTTVFLDANGNGVYDSGEPATVTDAVGQYYFIGLDPAVTYTIRQQPAGSSLQPQSADSYVKNYVW